MGDSDRYQNHSIGIVNRSPGSVVRKDMTKLSSFLKKQSGMVKCTIFVTQRCNLACGYCYIDKKNAAISIPIAQRILTFLFAVLKEDERLEIGLFGGEPLLEFDLVKDLIALIQSQEGYTPERVTISVVTNGTLLTDDMLRVFLDKGIVLCISCDGPPNLQDAHRHFRDGRGSSPWSRRTSSGPWNISLSCP